jgi:hypothetical protein
VVVVAAGVDPDRRPHHHGQRRVRARPNRARAPARDRLGRSPSTPTSWPHCTRAATSPPPSP